MINCRALRGGGGGGRWVLTYFPTLVPEFKNDKIPNFLYPLGVGVVDLLSNFCC